MKFDVTNFQMNMLFIISGCDKPKGLAIKAVLQKETDKDVNHGQVYPNLDTLAEKGLIEKGALDKRTNYYQITDAGEKLLDEYQYWQDQQRHTDTVAMLN